MPKEIAMSLLGRIFSSSKGGGPSSKSDTRDIERQVDTTEGQKAQQQGGEQVKRAGSDSDRELERWAAEDDKDVKRP
jgi:hypothetical protein